MRACSLLSPPSLLLALAIVLPGCAGGGAETAPPHEPVPGAGAASQAAAPAPAALAADASLDATAAACARGLAAELGLDALAEACVLRAVRAAWDGLDAELRARAGDPLRGALDEPAVADVIRTRQAALDALVLASLPPARRAAFERFVRGTEEDVR